MASTTVVDRLIIEFGLDPSLLKKGGKEARAEVKETKEGVTAAAGEMIGALHRVAAEFVSLFLTVKSIHGLVDLFSELNEHTRQLGISSRNYGESAAQLQDWGNIAEIAGGKVEDALSSIAGLQQSIFNAKQGYGWDEQLTNFGRIGVDTGVASGKMRDFHDILADTARALQQFSKPDRFQWAQKLGLQGGIANAVVEGPDQLEKYYRQQLKIHQTTDGDTQAAIRLAQAWDLLKDKMRGLATEILTKVSPALSTLFERFGSFVTGHQKNIEGAINTTLDWFSGPGPGQLIDELGQVVSAVATLAGVVNDVAGWFGKKIGKTDDEKPWFGGGYTATEKKYGLPIGTLDNKDLRGSKLDADQKADALSVLHEEFGGDKGDPTWSKAVGAFKSRYTDQSTVKKGWFEQQVDIYNQENHPTNATQGAGASPGVQKAIAAAATPIADTGSRGDVNLSIGAMHVNTQATDAHGIANDIDGALQRKLTVSLADGALS